LEEAGMKKQYEKPLIVSSHKLETRAVGCLYQADAVGACSGAISKR
jgi:hypothetical protein